METPLLPPLLGIILDPKYCREVMKVFRPFLRVFCLRSLPLFTYGLYFMPIGSHSDTESMVKNWIHIPKPLWSYFNFFFREFSRSMSLGKKNTKSEFLKAWRVRFPWKLLQYFILTRWWSENKNFEYRLNTRLLKPHFPRDFWW